MMDKQILRCVACGEASVGRKCCECYDDLPPTDFRFDTMP